MKNILRDLNITNKRCVAQPLLALACAAALFGCGTTHIPETLDIGYQENIDKAIGEWSRYANIEPIEYVTQRGAVVLDAPHALPEKFGEMEIDTSLSTKSKVGDLPALLKPFGLYVLIPDESLRDKPIVLMEFKGKLKDFLRAIGVAYAISFNWNHGGILTIDKTSQYIIKIPQDENIAKEIEGVLTAFGATNISSSLQGSSIAYDATYPVHSRVMNFVEQIATNSAMVSMNVAIVTVALDKDRGEGIDWAGLELKFGNLAIAKLKEQAASGMVGSNTGTTSTGTAGTTTAVTEEDIITGSNMGDMQALLGLGKEGAALSLLKGDFSLSGVLNVLSTYGSTETMQSVMFRTLSGRDVKMKSGQKIPYVDSVGVSNLGAGVNGTNGNTGSNGNTGTNGLGGGAFGSANIKDVDIGLELDLAPWYDAHQEVVSVELDMKLSTLLRFVELSAGNQLGTVTRPSTQEQEFTDVVKMRPGETVVIGGLTFNSISDNRSSLTPIEQYNMGGRKVKETRNAMFIVLRPMVTVYGQNPHK